MLNIVEKFITISGEAPIIGEPVYLIRFSKCNLNCSYCDTPFKDEVNDYFSREELIEDILLVTEDYPEIKVLFTGGEPLLDERKETLMSIIEEMKDIDFYIETNGSIPLENFSLANCYYVVDWKSPSSAENESFCIDNLKNFRLNNDCIKFVVAKNDFDWVRESIKFINKINPFLKIYISCQSDKLSLEELANFVLKNRLPVKISIQLHKYIWPNIERGV
jgi:7-carboxy-7-deazaguanine synthase